MAAITANRMIDPAMRASRRIRFFLAGSMGSLGVCGAIEGAALEPYVGPEPGPETGRAASSCAVRSAVETAAPPAKVAAAATTEDRPRARSEPRRTRLTPPGSTPMNAGATNRASASMAAPQSRNTMHVHATGRTARTPSRPSSPPSWPEARNNHVSSNPSSR